MGLRGPKPRSFWSQVEKGPDCWEWQGSLFTNGYGRTMKGRKSVGAHRRAYELVNGRIPDGMYVCHRCDNKRCVRPDHLFLGTPADNLRDMTTKGRSLVGSRNPYAKLTEEDVQRIRETYAAGGISQLQLGYRFGVSEHAVHQIVHQKTWRHV